MEKTMNFLIGFGLLTVLALGLLIGQAALYTRPEIIVEVARQERAKAEEIQARADAAKAAANQAWTEAGAAREAQPQITLGKQTLTIGFSVAGVILALGGALALVTWLNVRAAVVYPNSAGQWPILVRLPLLGNGLVAADLSRGIGPALIIGGGNVSAPLLTSEEAAVQIATQAQASGVMTGIAGRSAADDVVERVEHASRNLPAPTFASAGSGDVRFVHAQGYQRQQADVDRSLSDIEEFIRQGWAIGLSRDKWMGRRMARSTQYVSKTYWGKLIDRCAKAQIIRQLPQGGWEPAVALNVALDAFGIGQSDPDTGPGQAGRDTPPDLDAPQAAG